MASAKIRGLTVFNVNALREACDLGSELDGTGFNVYLTATTAEFVGGESEALTASLAIRWLDGQMAQMPTRGHPRHSLHAVRRKLVALLPLTGHALKGPAHTIRDGKPVDVYTGEELEL